MSTKGKFWSSVIILVFVGVLGWLFWSRIEGISAKALALVPASVAAWTHLAIGLAVASMVISISIASVPVPKFMLSSASRLPVLCWIAASLAAAMAALPYVKTAPAFVQTTAGAALLVLVGTCVVKVPRFSAGIVINGEKPVRSSGSGWTLVFRPLTIAFERIEDVNEVKETAFNDLKIQVELGGANTAGADKEYLKLEYSFKFTPDPRNWIRYKSFDEAKREQTMIDDLEGYVTDAFRDIMDIKEAYANLEKIADIVTERCKEKMQRRFGIIVNDEAVSFDDPEVPEELLKATNEREAKIREAKLQVEIQKENNRKDRLHLNKIDSAVKKMVKEHPELDPKEAYVRVQESLGIVKKSEQTFDIGPGLQRNLGRALSAWLDKGSEPDPAPQKGPIGFPKKGKP